MTAPASFRVGQTPAGSREVPLVLTRQPRPAGTGLSVWQRWLYCVIGWLREWMESPDEQELTRINREFRSKLW